jgi:hypothetical protein
MAEYVANAEQTVAANQDVLFTNTAVSSSNNSIIHREGSGLVTLRGITEQCRARFRVTFSANIAAATTADSISLAIAINGEPVTSTIMTSTPGAIEDYNNVGTSIIIDVPQGCCSQISVKSITTDQDVLVKNANLIVERKA